MNDLINPIDKEEFRQKFFSSKGFPHFCIDNFLDEDFANSIYESFPSYQEAQNLGREFSAVNEKRKIQITDSSKFPAAIKKLNDVLASKEYLDMWSDLTGVNNLLADENLVGGGIHETNEGGHLDVHVDFNYNEEKKAYRRLNILIYFNKDWKEEYGGYLDIWNSDVTKRYGYFEPRFNRACGFLTSDISFHGVTPLTCPTGVVRKSFATYYYTEEKPDDWVGEKHSTIFRARPDEWSKANIFMPYQQIKSRTRKNVKAFKSIVKSKIKK